ncbi:MAG TPA: MFS transporter [Candidatus Angelobacter sp.]|nr:MFS transporter [Candidatus Angelobacter sp.]
MLDFSVKSQSRVTSSLIFCTLSETRRMRVLLVLLYCVFALTGVLTALPGPWLPILAKKWMLTDTQAGSVIAAQFLGNTIGCFFAVRNLRSSLFLGLAMMLLGTCGAVFLRWPDLLICFFCYGIGLGLSIPATNLIVATLLPARRAVSLSLLNCVWGVGAISCPVLVLIAQRFGSMDALLLTISLGAGLLLVLLLACRWPKLLPTEQPDPIHASSLKHLLIFAVLLFLYVGTETCIAGWITLYGQRNFAQFYGFTPSPVTYFWAALILGRAASAYLLRWTSERSLYTASVALGLGAFILVLSGHSLAAMILGTILSGLALAPIFPLLLSFAAPFLLSAKNGGWVFACAALGGAVLPWATGKISTTYSTLHSGLMVPLAALFSLFMLSFWLPRFKERKPVLAASIQ